MCLRCTGLSPLNAGCGHDRAPEGSVKGKVTWGECTSDQTAWGFSAFGDLKSSLYVGQSLTK